MQKFKVDFVVTKCETGSVSIEAESFEAAKSYVDENFAELMDKVPKWTEKSIADEYLCQITTL